MFWLVERGEQIPVDDLIPLALETHRPAERWLFVNMVSSLDGATAARGEATPLADEDDRGLFMAMRAACDAVLVGAETVRAEDYGPVRLSARAQSIRIAAGLAPIPRLVIVSRSLRFEPAARVFGDSDHKPIILTGSDAPAHRRQALDGRAQVIVAGEVGVDPERALDVLAELGYGVVLCEGGPTLNAALVELDLVDEIDLTVSPTIAGGASSRIVDGATETLRPYRLERLMLGQKMLFLRYLRMGLRRPPA